MIATLGNYLIVDTPAASPLTLAVSPGNPLIYLRKVVHA
jgi:hypothetical protein